MISERIDKIMRRALLDPASAFAAMSSLAQMLTAQGVDIHTVSLSVGATSETATQNNTMLLKNNIKLRNENDYFKARIATLEKEALRLDGQLKRYITENIELEIQLGRKEHNMDTKFNITLTRLVPDFDMEARNDNYGRFKGDRHKLYAHIFAEHMKGVSPGDIGRDVGLARHRIVAVLRKMEKMEAEAGETVAPKSQPASNVIDFDALRTAATQKFDAMRDAALVKINELEGALA
jgi:hypothetical protein